MHFCAQQKEKKERVSKQKLLKGCQPFEAPQRSVKIQI